MAGEEPRYEAWLRTLPCAKCGAEFSIEVHHALWGTTYSPENTRPTKAIEGARKGKGQKAHSFFSLPLCIKCHIPGIHRGGGHFSGMSLEEREAWERELHPVYRNRYAMQAPGPAVPSMPSPAKRKRATAEGPRERELFLEEIADWAGAKRLKDHEHQLIHDLINDLRAGGI